MELPTYTSIWRIEKRLYKLYDFRLPMPLPVGQIVVFMAITVPYVVLLTLLGLPFSHTLFWLYVLPPGVLTWLATRPVLESKRLPELVMSQARYLGEPSVWCRMAPLAEKDEITVSGRVWRRGRIQPVLVPSAAAEAAPAIARTGERAVGRAGRRGIPAPATGQAAVPVPVRATDAAGGRARPPVPAARRVHQDSVPAAFGVSGPAVAPGPAPVAPSPWPSPAGRPRPLAVPGQAPLAPPGQVSSAPARPPSPAPARPSGPAPARPARAAAAASALSPAPAAASAPSPAAAPAAPPALPPASPPAAPPASPPVVVVPAQRAAAAGPPAVRPRAVERALSGPADQRSANWRDHVVVVPGGLGPGRPDHDKRDRVRAVLPVDGPRLVAVLGCTVGAGQTVTTLIVADLLASLRGEPVAALDLNPGPASLGELVAPRAPVTVGSLLAAPAAGSDQAGGPRHAAPRNHPAQQRSPGRLDVVTPEVRGDGSLALDDPEYRRLFDTVSARYPLSFADPGAAAVARVLAAADQLVLVTPASPDAARSLAMTTEWLTAHGYDALTANSITVLNGLSKRSMPHAEQAELVVRGRCRAIVRVPWDDHLAEPQSEQGIRDSFGQAGEPSRLRQLRPPVLQAYTALAGVLVASLASGAQQRRVAR
ncbi:MAG TPA: TcpE family conjugal transfer membrane protein [Streptosporangiaceae bacterium]